MPVYLQYYFWLISASLFCFLLERIHPWRKKQRVLRQGIGQDLFWLLFNGHYFGLLLALVTGNLIRLTNTFLHQKEWPVPQDLALLSDSPLWLQFIVFLLLKDFLEWNVHRLLHNVPWLWEFHKLHHSIEELDWIGNFRFHWGEILLYKAFTYLPLVILGIDEIVLLLIAVVWTVLLDLNHSNFRFSWGAAALRSQFFRHARLAPRQGTARQGRPEFRPGPEHLGLVVWNRLLPKESDQPQQLGFEGMSKYPKNVLKRLIYPFWKR